MSRKEDMIDLLVRHELGYELGLEIDTGSFGTCYHLKDNDELVVKHTTSISEAIYALRVFGVDCDHLAKIHKVIQIQPDYSKFPTFVIVQEYLDTDHEKLNDIQRAYDIFDYGLLHIYDTFDMDDHNEEVQEMFKEAPEAVQAIHEVQDGIAFHAIHGNQAADAHLNNLGVKWVDGEPKIALFDQMHLGLEFQIKNQIKSSNQRFNMAEHVSDTSQLIVKHEFELLDLMAQEDALEDDNNDSNMISALVNNAENLNQFSPS